MIQSISPLSTSSFFLLPVDLDNIHLIAHSSESFCSQFHINACGDSIFIQIIVWRITVTAQGDNGLFSFFFSNICIFCTLPGQLLKFPQAECLQSLFFPFHLFSIPAVLLYFSSNLTESSKSPAEVAKSNKQWVGTCLYQEVCKHILINCEAVIWL